MDDTKTGIWREGLAGLLRDALAKAPVRARSATSAVTASPSPSPSPALAERRSAPPPAPSRVHTMPLHIPLASELQPTRVWPIERLLENLPPPSAAVSVPAPPQASPAPLPPLQRPVSRRHVRIAAYVVTAGIVRAVLGLVQPAQPAVGARQALSQKAHAVQRAPLETPAPAPGAEAQPAALPGRALPAEAPLLGPAQLAQLERGAVDALIAGDHATARDRYAELARARPSERAFAVAAKILAARAREAAQP